MFNDGITDMNQQNERKIYRVSVDNNFHQMTVKQMTFHMLCETVEVDIDIAYNTMNKNLSIKVNKLQHDVPTKLNSKQSRLPYTLHHEELNLKFEINIDKPKQTFTLDVQQIPFENLPYRACPIHLEDLDEEAE